MNEEWLGILVGLFGAVFAIIGAVWGKGDNPQRFMNLVFEGVVLASAVILLVASLLPTWFGRLADQKVFLIVVSLAVIFYTLQNVARTLDWRKPDNNTER